MKKPESSNEYAVTKDITGRNKMEEAFAFQAHILSSLQDAICAVDENFHITYWNRMAEKMFGWKEHEAIGNPSKDIFRTVSPSNREVSITSLIENNGYIGEAVYKKKNGEEIYTNVVCSVIRNPQGEYKGNVSTFTDITGLKETEDELRTRTRQLGEANRQNEDILESISDCFYALSRDLSFTYVNNAAEKIWGISRADLIGRNIEDVFPSLIDISVSRFRKALEEQIPQYYEVYSKVIERWGDMTVYPTRDGISVYFHDTTERKKAEEVLRKNEERQKYMLKLSDALRPLSVAQAIKDAATRLLADYLGASQCNYTDYQNEYSVVSRENLNDASISVAGIHKLSDFPTTMEILYSGRDMIIPNLSAFQAFSEEERAHYLVFNIQANATVPIIKEGKLVATLTVRQVTPRDWTPEEVELLRETAERTWAAVVRAKAEERQRESEKQALGLVEELKTVKDNLSTQVKALNKLHEINSHFIRQDNIQTIYDEILDAAIEFTNSDFGQMQIVREDGRLEIIAAKGFSDPYLQFFHFVDGLHTTCSEAVKERKRVIAIDITQDPIYIGSQGLNVLLNEGIICIQSTPLFSRSGKLLGMLSTHYKLEHSFSELELMLLDFFARQAADVIEREEYEAVLHRTYLREDALGDLSNRLLESEDPQAVMEEICRKSIGYVECDVFINFIAEKGHLRLNAYSGISNEEAKKVKLLEYGEAVSGCAAAEGKRIVISDMQNSTDPRAQLVKSFGVLSYASFPLKSDDHIIGTLSFGSRIRKAFTQDQLLFMNIVSGHIAIAINRLIILEALRESEKKASILVSELEKADRNKNQFISTLSHELRNPLAVISAGLEIQNTSQDKAQMKRAKDIMNRQMNQLCALVDDLLDLTRITSNKIELKKIKIELNKLVSLIADDHRALFDEKKIELQTIISNDPIYLNADPVRLKQIIGNLLHNAHKYTQAGGKAIVSAYKDDNNAVISVKDDGIGLNPELVPHLFQPFVQADPSLDRSGGGLGLGLSITKGIAELHGGTVSARSEGLWKGSEFIIRLPLLEKASVDEVDEIKRTYGAARSRKVLIIEDNRDFADLLSTMLTTTGYIVEISNNGHEGMEKAKGFRPEVIFCDIGLPDMNGYEVANALKEEDNLKGTLLVALTGYAGESDLGLAKQSGFDRHIAKPVSLAALMQLLNG